MQELKLNRRPRPPSIHPRPPRRVRQDLGVRGHDWCSGGAWWTGWHSWLWRRSFQFNHPLKKWGPVFSVKSGRIIVFFTKIFLMKEDRVLEAAGVRCTQWWVKDAGRVWLKIELGWINSKLLKTLKKGEEQEIC